VKNQLGKDKRYIKEKKETLLLSRPYCEEPIRKTKEIYQREEALL
jgi:hypothetical protein